MPKQADIRVQVPGCTAARFWDVVYERPEATERYHTSFNESTYTTVTPWSACQRTVNFAMPLKLPDFVKRMVGLDSVTVSEVQRVVWHGGGSFTVTSETQVANMMGAGRFTTALQLSVNEEPEQHLSPPPPLPRHRHPQLQQPQQPASTQATQTDKGGEASTAAAARANPSASSASGTASPVDALVGASADTPVSPSQRYPKGVAAEAAAVERHLQLVYSVRCAASAMPWPMSATIENLMAEKALASMQNFLDFCKQLLDEHAAATASATSATGAAAGTGEAPEAEAGAAAGHVSPSSAAGAHPPPPLSPAGSTRGAAASCLRQRWPSITCSQDIGGDRGGAGGVGGGLGARLSALGATGEEMPFHMGRQDTLGSCGGDVFWDAPETFAGGSSGASSGVVSPRHHPGSTAHPGHLQAPPAALRHTSNNGMAAPAGSLAGGIGQATCVSGVPAMGAPVAASGATAADTQHLAVAVDHLTAAVAALDRKVEKTLQLLQQQQEFQQQLQQAHSVDATANLSIQRSNDNGGGARHRRCRHRGSTSGNTGGGDGGSDDDYENDGPSSPSGSDFRWFLRVTIALVLATLVVVGIWFLHPHVTGLRPHNGDASSSGGGPSGALHKPSVLRLSGEEYVRLGENAAAALGKAATVGSGGGGGAVRSTRRMATTSTRGGSGVDWGGRGEFGTDGSVVHLLGVTNRAGGSGGGGMFRRGRRRHH